MTKVIQLSPEEEMTLGALAMKGDRAAQDEIVKRNMPLAVALARMFARKWGITHMLDDCVQEACFGLMHAAKRFDPNKGKFSTYASLWIRTYIQKWFSMEVRRPTVSMNEPLPSEGSGEFQDLFATDEDSPEDNVISLERHRLVRKIVNNLGSKGIYGLQEVAQARFLDEMSLEEAGSLIGRTRERARQIELKALSKITNLVNR